MAQNPQMQQVASLHPVFMDKRLIFTPFFYYKDTILCLTEETAWYKLETVPKYARLAYNQLVLEQSH
jgi:hypothetical protein